MLAEVGSYLTNYDYVFKLKYRSMDEILHSLKVDKVPILVAGDFTKSGHYVTIIGESVKEDGSLIFHDPYGDWNTKYKSHEGNSVRYNLNELLKGPWKSNNRGYWKDDKYYVLTVKPVRTK
jgi:hypothetical protein